MKTKEVTKFDIAEYLEDDVMIAEYLNTVLEDGDSEDIITAIGHVAKAQGMTKIAEETGLSRPSLYKALSHGSKPQFETILKVLRAVGGNLNIQTAKLKICLTTNSQIAEKRTKKVSKVLSPRLDGIVTG